MSRAPELMRLINGYQISQALHVVAVLGIADLLAEGPLHSDALAEASGAHAPTLYRVMRALAASGVFHEDAERVFSLTPLGQGLRSDAPMPLGPWAEHIGRDYTWQAWAHLLHGARTGQVPFEVLHGTNSWDYRLTHPDDGAAFDRAMSALTRDVTAGIVDAYDFSPFARVVDVGGGHGNLLGGVLAANPGLTGVVFDQPHVVAGAAATLERLGVAGRCSIEGGDFFAHVPKGDLIMLKAILHDWDDASSVTILRSCRAALAPGGKVLVLERVMAGPNEGADIKYADLMMFVGVNGRERTEAQFAALFAAAGLRFVGTVPTRTRMSAIEAEA